MANKINWEVESVANLLTTELDNAAPAAIIVDAADYANATNKFRFADFFLHLTAFDDVPHAGDNVELHLFYQLDGTLYCDGEAGDVASPTPSGNSLHGIFLLEAAVGPQNQQILGVPLSPFDFRACVVLNITHDLTDVSTHFVKMYPYNEEIQ